ncbi:MAG: response regulator [Acidobacteriota bacterium]
MIRTPPDPCPEVLIVDDNPLDVHLIESILKTAWFDVSVRVADNGASALVSLREGENLPDLVLTDLQMPRMDGIELVQRLRREFSSLPVILMTAFGNEEVALRALQKGAVSYVPKKSLQSNLIRTLEQILEVVSCDRKSRQVRRCLVESEHHYVLQNDLLAVPAIIEHLGADHAQVMQCDENERIRLTIALSEALSNAICHGNLEIASGLRETADGGWKELVEQRRGMEPYCNRRVTLIARVSRSGAAYTVRDEGPGFEPASLPDPRDSTHVARVGGRGLFLISLFMDEVVHNDAGNEITMYKNPIR